MDCMLDNTSLERFTIVVSKKHWIAARMEIEWVSKQVKVNSLHKNLIHRHDYEALKLTT